LLLKKPEEIKIVLNSEETFDKPEHGLNMFFKYGLLTEGGEKYKTQRKAVTPFFLPSNLKRFYPIINDKFTAFLNDFDKDLKAEEFDITHTIMNFTLDTILLTMFNRSDFSKRQVSEFIENTDGYLKLCSERMFKLWLANDFIFKRSKTYAKWKNHRDHILNFSKNIIEQNESIHQNGDTISSFKTFSDHLYKIRSKMEIEEVLEDVTLLMLASYETTGSVLPHIILALALNQTHQEKVYDEVSKILSSADDEVTEDMCNQMQYLERFIKEGLRFFPAALMLGRQANKDLKLGNYFSCL
jgi:cytochrome P450 family 4